MSHALTILPLDCHRFALMRGGARARAHMLMTGTLEECRHARFVAQALSPPVDLPTSPAPCEAVRNATALHAGTPRRNT